MYMYRTAGNIGEEQRLTNVFQTVNIKRQIGIEHADARLKSPKQKFAKDDL